VNRLAVFTLATAALALQAAAAPWSAAYAELLAKYATPDGVRYAAWHADAADRKKLASVVDAIAQPGAAPADGDAAFAFYLDAYNAHILAGVLARYPVRSVTEIAPDFGFFSRTPIRVNGEPTTFNDLEKKLILPRFKDPRAHFALNCASRSCPPLHAQPFSASDLGPTLDRLTRAFLEQSPHGVRPTPKPPGFAVSKIFEWYAADFAPGGGPRAFIARHRSTPLPASPELPTFDYDWALNEAR
jgi:hypothetical protein